MNHENTANSTSLLAVEKKSSVPVAQRNAPKLPLGLKIAALILLFIGAWGFLAPLWMQTPAWFANVSMKAYVRGWLFDAVHVVAGLGILYRKGWARSLALSVLVLSTPFSIAGCAWALAHGRPDSPTYWLEGFIQVVLGNGLLFYLIYRRSSANAFLHAGSVSEKQIGMGDGDLGNNNGKEPKADTQKLPIVLRIAAIYLLMGGMTGTIMPRIPHESALFGWMMTMGNAGEYPRAYLLDAAFAVAGAGILCRASWAGRLALALLILTIPFSTAWSAWGLAGGEPNSPLYYVVSFGEVVLWNGFWFYLIWNGIKGTPITATEWPAPQNLIHVL